MRRAPVLPALLALGALALIPLAVPAQPSEPGPARQLLSFSPDITCDSQSEPGSVVRVRARSAERIDSLTAYLADADGGVIARAASFPADAGSHTSWDALIGVPSTAHSGSYRVLVTAASLGREALVLAPLSVTRRAFRSENIALNQPLTTLRAGYDPRKVEEAQRLRELLSSARADDLLERGAFAFPVVGAVRTAGYGDRREYRYATGGSDSSVHDGLDLALPEGRPVSACGQGRVVLAGERIVTGLSVVIEHLPGVYSLYFHLSEISVREGEVVEKGSLLGRVGQTGLATGPHLHWEVQVRGVAVDPEPFVRAPILDDPASGTTP